MKTLTALLFAVALSAQTSVVPSGPWPLCEPSGIPGSPFCIGFTPGVSEAYFILVRDVPYDVVAFRYTATATVNGKQVALSGVAARWDSRTGWPAVGVSIIPIAFGGVATDIVVSVDPLVVKPSVPQQQ